MQIIVGNIRIMPLMWQRSTKQLTNTHTHTDFLIYILMRSFVTLLFTALQNRVIAYFIHFWDLYYYYIFSFHQLFSGCSCYSFVLYSKKCNNFPHIVVSVRGLLRVSFCVVFWSIMRFFFITQAMWIFACHWRICVIRVFFLLLLGLRISFYIYEDNKYKWRDIEG